MDTTTATAEAMEKARVAAGISRKALAEATGIPRTTLARRLEGKAPSSTDDIERIAAVLRVSPTVLVKFVGVAA